jgi:hypothetical protein
MPAEEVQTQLASARDAFRTAIELVGGRWDEAGLEPEDDPEKPWANGRDGTPWSPRRVAEHALSSDELNENALRAALGETVEQPEVDANLGRKKTFPTLGSAQAALDYLDRRAAVMSALIESVSAEDFANDASLRPGLEQYARHFGFDTAETLEGRFAVAAAHWTDHAQQLTRFAEAS